MEISFVLTAFTFLQGTVPELLKSNMSSRITFPSRYTQAKKKGCFLGTESRLKDLEGV